MGRRDCATDRQFHKRSQLFIRTHNKTLSVAAMRVCNPDRSPVGINRCDRPTPTGFAGLACDDFLLLHAHLNAVNVFWSPGQAGSQEFIYPLIAAVTGPILTFAPPAFFVSYSRNWPLPRSMARGPWPTLKIVFSPRRVIV